MLKYHTKQLEQSTNDDFIRISFNQLTYATRCPSLSYLHAVVRLLVRFQQNGGEPVTPPSKNLLNAEAVTRNREAEPVPREKAPPAVSCVEATTTRGLIPGLPFTIPINP